MNEFEQQHLPEAYRPLSPWAYFGLTVLYSVPVVGLVFLICYAIGSKNVNKRNFSRSYFCVYAVILILAVLASVLNLLPMPDALSGLAGVNA